MPSVPLTGRGRSCWRAPLLAAARLLPDKGSGESSPLSRPSFLVAAFAKTRVFLHRHRGQYAPEGRPRHIMTETGTLPASDNEMDNKHPPGSTPVGMPSAVNQRLRPSHRESRHVPVLRALVGGHRCRGKALHCSPPSSALQRNLGAVAGGRVVSFLPPVLSSCALHFRLVANGPVLQGEYRNDSGHCPRLRGGWGRGG